LALEGGDPGGQAGFGEQASGALRADRVQEGVEIPLEFGVKPGHGSVAHVGNEPLDASTEGSIKGVQFLGKFIFTCYFNKIYNLVNLVQIAAECIRSNRHMVSSVRVQWISC